MPLLCASSKVLVKDLNSFNNEGLLLNNSFNTLPALGSKVFNLDRMDFALIIPVASS